MRVVVFGRARIVDLGSHSSPDAVTRDWVCHRVRGNEFTTSVIDTASLTEGAAIPGGSSVVCWQHNDWGGRLGDRQSSGRDERLPIRRGRLSHIAEPDPNVNGHVDDRLGSGDGASRGHDCAWEPESTVHQDERDPTPPRIRQPLTDGGLPCAARLAPANASMVSSFLEEHADAPGFELTYTAGGADHTRLLHDASLHAVTLERPAAAPALLCTPIAPSADRFTVRVDAIEMLTVVEPTPESYTADAETPAEMAVALRRLAKVNPEAVRVSAVLALVDHAADHPRQQRDALRALRLVAAVRPDECTPAIPILRSVLPCDDLVAPVDALAELRAIGNAEPGELAAVIDVLVPYLSSTLVSARREATRCIAAIADECPGDAIDAVPALATIAEDGTFGQQYAVYALSRIAHEYPAEVKPVAEPLADILLDDSLSDGVRSNATAALGRIVAEYPNVGVDHVADVATLFEVDNHELRNNAIGLLGDVAMIHTDVIEPYADAIAVLLTSDDTYIRINASGVLGRVAMDFPESVQHVAPTFVDLLSDDEPLVRENACWALGHLRARGAEAALETRACDDEHPDVRDRAAWALSQLVD